MHIGVLLVCNVIIPFLPSTGTSGSPCDEDPTGLVGSMVSFSGFSPVGRFVAAIPTGLIGFWPLDPETGVVGETAEDGETEVPEDVGTQGAVAVVGRS